MAIIFAKGPPTTKVSKTEAEAAIKRNPDFPKGAEVTVEELEGHWVAAVHVADGPPFGQPADSSEESSGPKSEGPDDTSPDDGGSDDEGSDAPPKDDGGDGPPHKDDGGGGDKALLHHVLDLVSQIGMALGIPPAGAGAEGMVPGEEGPPAPPGPPHGPSDGPHGGPPHGPPGAGGPDQEIKHERTMKPGEAPPGTTPVGAPAFAHTFKGGPHPWSEVIGKVPSFDVEERIPDDHTIANVDHELQELAYGTPYKVKQIVESRNEHGHRIARAKISVY
jgi:hypothetical protein